MMICGGATICLFDFLIGFHVDFSTSSGGPLPYNIRLCCTYDHMRRWLSPIELGQLSCFRRQALHTYLPIGGCRSRFRVFNRIFIYILEPRQGYRKGGGASGAKKRIRTFSRRKKNPKNNLTNRNS